jgi:hypothetical protein
MSSQMSALLLTLAVEIPLAGLLARAFAGDWRRALPVALLASCATHPVAWKLAAKLGPDDYREGLALIEAGVVLAEAGIYRLLARCKAMSALGISAVCNAASWTAGFVLLGS